MIQRLRPSFGRHIAAVLTTAFIAVTAAACSDTDPTPTFEGIPTTPTPSAVSTSSPIASNTATEPSSTAQMSAPTVTSTAPGTETATGSLTATPAEANEAPDPQARLRRNLTSSLTTGLSPDETREALKGIDVVSAVLATEDRNLWVAVTSGAGIYALPEAREHVAAIYELIGDDWVELANMTLASGPTFAEIEIVAEEYDGSSWIAIHGVTGAHSGTFELLEFDGLDLRSNVWWFSSMPAAATAVDLDGVDPPEIVLNATDPYVYCYACGVRAWDEVIYRWVGGELVEVPLAAVEADSQAVSDWTEVAAVHASADLWQRALDAATEAHEADPEDMEVWWLFTLISRIAESRLSDAGAEQQPFMTNVLAGEYGAAVDLMRPHGPAAALSPTGPLIAGTVAEDGWAEATATWVLDYTERALSVAPDLAAAHATRAFGRLAADPNDWSGALREMEEALRLEPLDHFYREAVEYLFAQDTVTFG